MISVLLIAATESANLGRRNCRLFQHNQPYADIANAPANARLRKKRT